MGWTGGKEPSPLTPERVIAFALSETIARECIVRARMDGNTLYAAMQGDHGVYGLVVLLKREGGQLWAKAITEDMGPAQANCPADILALLTHEPIAFAAEWRAKCKANAERSRVLWAQDARA